MGMNEKQRCSLRRQAEENEVLCRTLDVPQLRKLHPPWDTQHELAQASAGVSVTILFGHYKCM